MRISAFVRWMATAILISTHPAAAEEMVEAKRAQAEVGKIVHALYAGDVETVLGHTHPLIVAMQGGEDATRQGIQQAIAQMTRIGMRLETLSFPKDPTFLESGGKRYVVVPTLSIISAGGQRVESLNFQLGAFDAKSKRWGYVEGSRINRENVQILFPGFPKDYEFPTFYRKKL